MIYVWIRDQITTDVDWPVSIPTETNVQPILCEKLKHFKGRQEFSNISQSGSHISTELPLSWSGWFNPPKLSRGILAHRTSNNEQGMFNHLRNERYLGSCSNHSQFRWARIPSMLFLFLILLDTILIRGATRWGFQPNWKMFVKMRII